MIQSKRDKKVDPAGKKDKGKPLMQKKMLVTQCRFVNMKSFETPFT